MASPTNLPRRLNRPDFEIDEVGAIVNPDHLSPQLKKLLWDLLPNRIEHGQRCQLLSLVGESLQLAEWLHIGASTGEQLEQLYSIQSRARELLKGIAELSPDARAHLRAHSITLAIGSAPPAYLSQVGARVVRERKSDLLGYFWDAAQDLETAAAHAGSYLKPRKTDRPSQSNARRLTALVAKNVYTAIGRLPPRSKGTWFPLFMAELGNAAGCSIGLALVANVVERLENPNALPAPDSGRSMLPTV